MKKIFIPFLLIGNLCFGQVNLNLGLRAYYPFSGNANDVSGNNNNPVFNNAVLTADRLGNPNSAYHFNGTNTYMRVNNNPTINMGNTMSLSLWVKPTGYYTGTCYNNMMLMKADVDFVPGLYSLRFSDVYTGCSAPTTTQERFYDGNGTIATNPIVQLNQWYSVVVTYDGTTARMYVNCVLQATNPFTGSFTNLYDLYFGHTNSASFPYWLNGDLDEIRIYDRALTVDEVNVLGGCPSANPCSTWLRTQVAGDRVTVGDLDVSGTQLTVEANVNRVPPLNSGSFWGHIVTKHTNTANANYALSLTGCEITTTNGYTNTGVVCQPLMDKTYHIAQVYDGSTLKFYRNGFLMSSVPCTGNMVTNDLLTTFGQVAGNGYPFNNQFMGYINEVRIWNVARTQTQIQTYMNTSLPSPPTQTGLLGYYVFDDLANKQGNAAFNGTIGGGATINNTNPLCTVIVDSCAVINPCSTWLKTQVAGDKVSIGDLDISGNQVTVEANFNKTSPGGPLGGGFLVSKHTTAGNINYALEPDGCAISTVNGDVLLEANCSTLVNKTYHVAMVYDGSSVKFYRNGFLHKQAPLTGNLALNNFIATIGENSPGGGPIYPFNGNINEVRIWNVARTQAQIQTYMNASLPNPTTQTGLQGYYVFDNLINKQGNAVYNGTLNGGATINTTNPNCTFIADNCPVNFPPISNIINDYTPVLGFNICENKITVEDATFYKIGDTVLMIQMKGAAIDSTNTVAFGTITDYKNSGNYEFNYIKSKVGNVIELRNKLLRQYDIPTGKVQLIRVPYYNSVDVTNTLTCLPWDGSKGGVLVLNTRDTLNLSANIDVSGKGFRGGKAQNSAILNFQPFCSALTYYSPSTANAKQEKGEGIAEVSDQKRSGRGPLANGGGGANMMNSGGGGGSNGNVGGQGGDQYQDCTATPDNVGGLGGKPLSYSSAQNKIFLGGGGGAGDANDPNGAASFHPDGGNGGGIIIIRSNYIQSNNFSVIANGDNGKSCTTNCTEGMGGGGAGGTILLDVNNYISPANPVTGKGGKGSDNISHLGFNHGPGGGGSGAVLFLRNASLPAAITANLSGGLNGISQNTPNVTWGAQPGNTGQTVFNLQLPFTTVLFKPNIDSVRIKDSILNCNGFDFKGFGYTNTNPIATWQWYFGDGNTASTQNTSHAYGAAGTYNVKLVVTDINGCRDSIAKDVVALAGIVAEAGLDTAFCSNTPITVVLHGSGAGTYSWTPAGLLNDPTLQNPTATVSITTKFYLTVTSASSCNALDSVTISVNTVPLVQTLIDTAVCKNAVLMLTTTAGLANYNWSTGIYVSDSTIANPFFIDTVSRTLVVTGTNSFGCFAKDTINITVKPLPVVRTIGDTTICNNNTVTLVTTGAQTYLWSPVLFLSDPTIANPVYSGNLSQTYFVTGTAANGCKATDTVAVNVNSPMVFQAPPDKNMCSTNSVVLNGNNGTSVDYLWSPGTYLSSTTIINPVANPPSTMSYNVLVTDRTCNTDSSFTVQVIVGASPLVNAGKSNDIDCAHRSATLFASGGTTYSWSPSTGLSDSNIPNPVANPASTQQYIVTVTDAGGCSAKDTVTVFKNMAASLARYMPNAFTPNGDGKNDCYGLKNWLYVKKLQFFIYNRYGELVFATANLNKCWDGTYKGKPALAGTYVFYIKAETDCGIEEQKGNLLLIR